MAAAAGTACALAAGAFRAPCKLPRRAPTSPITKCKPLQSAPIRRRLSPAAAVVAAATPTSTAEVQAQPSPEAQEQIKEYNQIGAVTIQSLFTDYVLAIPPALSSYRCTEEQASRMVDSLLEAISVGTTDAAEIAPYFLGPLLLSANGSRMIDGQQRLLTLCLLLAAVRKSLLAAGGSVHLETAEEIKRLLVQSGGGGVGAVLEQAKVQWGGEKDAVFLRRLLLDAPSQEGQLTAEELAREAQHRLWANLQLFRRQLAELDLPRLQLLVQFITVRVCVAVTRLPTAAEAFSLLLANISWPDLLSRGLSLEHIPAGSEALAASADLIVTIDGCRLPLHCAVLAAGSRVLRLALAGAGSAAAAKEAAVQEAFMGHPLADVQLFLMLLYSGFADAGESVGDPWTLAGAVPLAYKLDSPYVLQARRARQGWSRPHALSYLPAPPAHTCLYALRMTCLA
ncbi:hypothetical protein ABPG75_000107 [Micractinium tetrahymenae]